MRETSRKSIFRMKALAPGQAAKVDFRGETLSRQILPVRNAAVQNELERLLDFPLANFDFGVMIREDTGCAKMNPAHGNNTFFT